ncbi:hypothetical protein EYF80_000207 [Liparis tanakae]|uniref:Uncharacterized protein n=1 Tax=Liparis tanakae TaxID=230148 RepID=A0A4Z2JIL8_9TELE|nr:hypothetical protein EYF80_000207 [Liparis tanakae]
MPMWTELCDGAWESESLSDRCSLLLLRFVPFSAKRTSLYSSAGMALLTTLADAADQNPPWSPLVFEVFCLQLLTVLFRRL